MDARGQAAFGLVLTAAAGWIDAIGYLSLGGLYTSLMSGNATQLGIALGQGAWPAAATPALLIAVFVAGGFLGTGAALLAPARWAVAIVLGLEALVLAGALAAFLAGRGIVEAGALLALAMGGQNAVIRSTTGFRAGTTFITGALFGVGQALANALAGRAPARLVLRDGVVGLALLLGAGAGGIAHRLTERAALAVPTLAVAGLALTALVLALARGREG